MKNTCYVYFAAMLITSILLSANLYAGSSWNSNTMLFERPEENSFSAEAGFPEYKDYTYEKVTGQIFFLTLNYNLNDTSRLITEIPFTAGKIEINAPMSIDEHTEELFGNVYLALDLKNDFNNSSTEIGIYLPTASDDKVFASRIGKLGDFDRYPAYEPDLKTIKVIYKKKFEMAPEISFGIQCGPMFHFDAEHSFPDDTELLLQYGGLASFNTDTVVLNAAFTGHMMITESGLDFEERIIHHLGVSACLNLSQWAPGLYIKFPIDDTLDEALEHVFGIFVSVNF